jgi:hypothetical protein
VQVVVQSWKGRGESDRYLAREVICVDTQARKINSLTGSPLHAVRAFSHPRWEDYHYEYLEGCKNRLYWLGDGQTVADKDPKGDSKIQALHSIPLPALTSMCPAEAFYLKEVDYPPGKFAGVFKENSFSFYFFAPIVPAL